MKKKPVIKAVKPITPYKGNVKPPMKPSRKK
jgi:hypothetical protein